MFNHLTDQAFLETIKALESGNPPGNLYHKVLRSVEKGILKAALEYADDNQTEVARILGIHRTTVRKRCLILDLIEYTLLEDKEDPLKTPPPLRGTSL